MTTEINKNHKSFFATHIVQKFHDSYGKNDLIWFCFHFYWCDSVSRRNAYHMCVGERHVTQYWPLHIYFIAAIVSQYGFLHTHCLPRFLSASITFPHIFTSSSYCAKKALNFWYNLIYKFNTFEMFFMFLFFSHGHTLHHSAHIQYDYTNELNIWKPTFNQSNWVGSFNIFIIFDFFPPPFWYAYAVYRLYSSKVLVNLLSAECLISMDLEKKKV